MPVRLQNGTPATEDHRSGSSTAWAFEYCGVVTCDDTSRSTSQPATSLLHIGRVLPPVPLPARRSTDPGRIVDCVREGDISSEEIMPTMV